MTRNWKDHGIIFSNPYNLKKLRIRCPDCSETRLKHPSEKCMTIDVDNGFYHCYHCGKSGYVPTEEEIVERRKRKQQREEKLKQKPRKGSYNRPKEFRPELLIKNCTSQPDAQPLIHFLTETRKLDIDVLQKYKITIPYASFEKEDTIDSNTPAAPNPANTPANTPAWYLSTGSKEKNTPAAPNPANTPANTPASTPAKYHLIRCIAFNFFDRGEYINVKSRTIDKRFTFLPKGELIPWNIDSIIDKDLCYITEGELDALTLLQCGFLETISVPNGAQKNLTFLDRFVETHFEDKKRIVLALDNDEKGIMLRNELIRRFDSERCLLVEWPKDCKDANDVLMKHGVEKVRECVEDAKEIPLVGIQTASDVEGELLRLFENGLERGAAIGLPDFDRLMTFETGRYMVVSGRPGDGKSEFIDEVCLRLCLLHNWKIAYFSPENVPIVYHLRKLCEKLTRYPFKENKSMTREMFHACVSWLSENVCHILPGYGEDGVVDFRETLSGGSWKNGGDTKSENTLENILEIAHRCVARRGVRILVIDPLNRIDAESEYAQHELAWYSHVNNTLSRFARRYKCLVILVAHPRKVNRANFDGKKRRVEMNDINGSADFGNKADYCMIVDRDDSLKTVSIYVDKVKFKHLGSRGDCFLHYDMVSGRYVPCALKKIDPTCFSPSSPAAEIVTSSTGTKYEKTIDWRNNNSSWIDRDAHPILYDFLNRFKLEQQG